MAGNVLNEPDRILFVEVPGEAERLKLGARHKGAVSVGPISKLQLRMALKSYENATDEDHIMIDPPWVACDRGYKIPIPILRLLSRNHLQVLEGAASLSSMLSAVDAGESGSFPVLLVS
jgi:hypothetical protein